jgi:hypothetical protein
MVTLTKEEEDKIRGRLYKLGYLGEEVTLDNNYNYIVSGLERSGTSLMMQLLQSAGVPIAYDSDRLPDINNPKGYFELFNGKIINKLIDKVDDIKKYRGKFIKITSYGLKYLPQDGFPNGFGIRKYKIIYMQRNIDEIIDSMEKMTKVNESNKKETKQLLLKLNDYITDLMEEDNNISPLYVDYNKLLKEPMPILLNICKFLGIPETKAKKMALVIDQNLYKERR